MELKWLTNEEINKLLADKAFNKELKADSFKYFIPKYIDYNDQLLAAIIDNKVVGLLQLSLMPRKEKVYAMKYVTVHPKARNQGVAKALLREMVNKVSLIPEASLELSSYEKEGEVLIETVHQLALEYPELSLKHRTWGGGPYQEAKNLFLKADMEVLVEDPTQEIYGVGKILFFQEYTEPLKVVVRIDNKNYEVEPKYIKKS